MHPAELATAIDNLTILRDLCLDLAALRWTGDLAALEELTGRTITVEEVLATTTNALLEGRRGPLRLVG